MPALTSGARWRAGLAVLAVAVYLTMWFGWELGWDWLATVDAATLDVGYRIGVEHHGWVIFWDVLCTVFSPVVFRMLAGALIVLLLVRRQGRVALFLVLSVEVSGLVTEVAKGLADRPRPATAMVDASSTSFPSGHAVGSMVAVLALAAVLAPYVRRSLWPWAIAGGTVIVVAVGVGRVALNVHHLSDVLAGWALGYLYSALCLLMLRPRVTAADERPAAPDTAP